jgi:hypothetical protein
VAKFELSNIADDKADLRFAQRLVGFDAKASGRIRLVEETGRLEVHYVGALGEVWLPIPCVSKKVQGTVGQHGQVGQVRLDG